MIKLELINAFLPWWFMQVDVADIIPRGQEGLRQSLNTVQRFKELIVDSEMELRTQANSLTAQFFFIQL